MPELLIAPASPLPSLSANSSASPRQNSSSGSAAESKPNANNAASSESKPKVNEASSANSASAETRNADGATASDASASAKSNEGSEGASGSFASVLKKSMSKAADGKGANSTGKIDPLSLTGTTGAAEGTDEGPAISAFIEQLIPQLANKSLTGDEEKAKGSEGATQGAGIVATLIAGPMAVAAHNAALDVNDKNKEHGTENGELKSSVSDLRASQLSDDLAANAAISADDAKADTGSGKTSRLESDFSAVLKQATEQISVSGQASTSNAARAATGTEGSMQMNSPVGHADWSNELGNKLTWMATAQKQQADLVLNPPQLGRVEISLTVAGDQASATFASPNAEVRELLEDSLPRLREILAGAGINLGEAHVGSESANRFGMHDQKGDNSSGRHSLVAEETADMPLNLASTASTRSVTVGRGMVDMFV